jgi:hypothetical protein
MFSGSDLPCVGQFIVQLKGPQAICSQTFRLNPLAVSQCHS